MTLATDILTLLDRITQALERLLSSDQPAERCTPILRQLAATAEAALRVAETERLKAETMMVRSGKMKTDAETARLNAETKRWKVGAETEQLVVETKKAGNGAAKALAEAEKLQAEAMMARSEKLRIDAETNRLNAETERMKAEGEVLKVEAEAVAERAKKEVERLVAEMEKVKAHTRVMICDSMKLDAQTERLKVDIGWKRAETEAMEARKVAERPVADVKHLPGWAQESQTIYSWENVKAKKVRMRAETDSMYAEPAVDSESGGRKTERGGKKAGEDLEEMRRLDMLRRRWLRQWPRPYQ